MRYNRLHKDNNGLTPTTYTQELSRYAEGLRYEDIPQEVIERAKMILIHTVGAALAAQNTPVAQKAEKMALEANGGEGGPVALWGSDKKMAAVNAALALGAAADALDWEDCSWTGHPAAGVIPCAWAAAQERHRSGRELLAAIVAGYEVYQRIACSVQPSEERWSKKGWGMTSWQIFSAIIPAAKLSGLDARKIDQAIGVGCECSTFPGSYHNTTMSDFGHYEHGYRARDGILIVKSVEKGIHNQRDALDEPRCYTGVVCGDDGSNGAGETVTRSAEADVTWLTRDLGSRYLLLETALRPWPASMWVQTPLELVSRLVKEHHFAPDEVEEIVIDPATHDRMWAPADGLTSITHAQCSAPYVIAALLCGVKPGAAWYAPETMADPRVLALAGRVKAGPSPEDSPMSSFLQFRAGSFPRKTVTVRLKDGTVYTASMDRHPGHPAEMFSREALSQLFRAQAEGVLPAGDADKALDTLWSIETVEDLASLSGLFR